MGEKPALMEDFIYYTLMRTHAEFRVITLSWSDRTTKQLCEMK